MGADLIVRRGFLCAIALAATLTTASWWHTLALVCIAWLTLETVRPCIAQARALPPAAVTAASCALLTGTVMAFVAAMSQAESALSAFD